MVNLVKNIELVRFKKYVFWVGFRKVEKGYYFFFVSVIRIKNELFLFYDINFFCFSGLIGKFKGVFYIVGGYMLYIVIIFK